MKFSVSLPLLRDLTSRDPYRDTFELANIAEEAGLTHVFRTLAERQGASRFTAVATSAVREAKKRR